MKRTLTCALALTVGCLLSLAPAPARCEAQTVDHTIRSGDNLHLIAGYYFGDPRQWKKIWKANRTKVSGPNVLVPGKVLRIEGAAGGGWQGSYEEFRSLARAK